MEVPRDIRNSKSGNITTSGENCLNIRTNASHEWDGNMCQGPLLASRTCYKINVLRNIPAIGDKVHVVNMVKVSNKVTI